MFDKSAANLFGIRAPVTTSSRKNKRKSLSANPVSTAKKAKVPRTKRSYSTVTPGTHLRNAQGRRDEELAGLSSYADPSDENEQFLDELMAKEQKSISLDAMLEQIRRDKHDRYSIYASKKTVSSRTRGKSKSNKASNVSAPSPSKSGFIKMGNKAYTIRNANDGS